VIARTVRLKWLPPYFALHFALWIGIPMSETRQILAQLMAVIEDRKAKRPENSYTTKLFNGGIDAIGAKVCEEAAEVVDAASVAHEDRGYSVTYEAADLLYHLLVMLAYCDVPLIDVEEELARRFGKSGLRHTSTPRQ
jgi:phosphoribosyl-ATP pyrophosphohydrolase